MACYKVSISNKLEDESSFPFEATHERFRLFVLNNPDCASGRAMIYDLQRPFAQRQNQFIF